MSSGGFYLNTATSLVMSQKLQQAIQILQYNNLELSEFLKSETEKNPFIKLIYKNPVSKQFTTNQDINAILENYPHTKGFEQNILEQITQIFSSTSLKNIALLLFENLNEHGFMKTPMELLAIRAGKSVELIESVLKKLQKCISPTGVFARNITECLILKLSEKYDDNIPINLIKIAQKIESITQKKLEDFIKTCGIHKTQILSSLKEIMSLGLYPNISITDSPIVRIPDVFVHKTGLNNWKIELNRELLPKAVIDEEYVSLVRKTSKTTTEKNFYRENIDSAHLIVNAIHQRSKTILAVTKEILNQQRDFFEHGPEYITPMILKDIADEINMHESTVSRATSNKYILTDFGIFEFKYFFSSKTEDSLGNSFSSNMIKEKIKNLIKQEDKLSPYSDEVIASLLSKVGINVARRTVSKYREALNIPTSTKRKKNKILYKI